MDSSFLKLQKKIGYEFKNEKFLSTALTHKSFYNNSGKNLISNISKSFVTMDDKNYEFVEFHNERLEILGDAVIELVVTEYLFKRPEILDEGRITRTRAYSVNRSALSKAARNLNLQNIMLLGEAEKKSSRNQSERLQADAFEALIGAVYMDSGLADAAKIIVSLLEPYIEEALKSKTGYPDDYKSKLQELMHTLTGETPVYRMIDSTGPDHDKYFKVEVNLNINNNHFSEQGMGKSIQKAEQQAAHKILSVIEKNRDGIFSDEKI